MTAYEPGDRVVMARTPYPESVPDGSVGTVQRVCSCGRGKVYVVFDAPATPRPSETKGWTCFEHELAPAECALKEDDA